MFHFGIGGLVDELLPVLLLLPVGVNDNLLCMAIFINSASVAVRLSRTPGSVTQDVSGNVEVFPDDQSLCGTEFESLESVVHTEAVFSSILADFVEVLLDELLLLHKLDV